MKMYGPCVLVLIFFILPSLALFPIFGRVELTVTCDGPATRDIPLQLHAVIKTTTSDQFYIQWSDDGRHSGSTQPSRAKNWTWTVTYDKDSMIREYQMYVTVYKLFPIFNIPEEVASGEVKYNLTDSLIVNVDTYQDKNLVENGRIATGKATEFRASVHDPTGFLANNTDIVYYWMINGSNHGPQQDPSFIYVFDQKAHYTVQVIMSANPFSPIPDTTTTTSIVTTTTTVSTITAVTNTTRKPSSASTTTVSTEHLHTNVTPYNKRSLSSIEIDDNVDFPAKYGTYTMLVQAEDPVYNVTLSGERWLKHGDLLQLNVKCTGSVPFQYCWYILPGGYNVTGNETCAASGKVVTTTCDIVVEHYFPISDSYTVLLLIANDVSVHREAIPVNIYEVNRKQQLSVIIVPVTCTVFAIIIVVFGVAYYIQNRNRFTVEVADFDFGHEENLEPRTFYERLHESFLGTSRNSTADDREPLQEGHAATYGAFA